MRVLHAFAGALFAVTASAQTATPLPPNYKVLLENEYVLVQRVHYGPHEFVPMHDHPPATTVYVYLSDSGVVDITHEGPEGSTVHRPPTHAGAFRISPGNFERHSVQNTSDLPSDFLRIELKHLPPGSITGEFRGAASVPPLVPGRTTVFSAPGVRIERIVCAGACSLPDGKSASVIVPIRPVDDPLPPDDFSLPLEKLQTEALWEPNYRDRIVAVSDGKSHEPTQLLRIILEKQ